jgi:hypothetical protein
MRRKSAKRKKEKKKETKSREKSREIAPKRQGKLNFLRSVRRLYEKATDSYP